MALQNLPEISKNGHSLTDSLTDFSRPKLSPDFKQSKNGCICVKFGTHVLWHNTHDAYFFIFDLSCVFDVLGATYC